MPRAPIRSASTSPRMLRKDTGCFDVLDPAGRFLKATRLAFALPLESEGDEALTRQAIDIQARDLLLDAGGGM